MHLDAIGPVLEGVLLPLDLERQLPLFAGQDDTAIQMMGERTADHEPARFDGDNFLDGAVAIMRDELVDHLFEAPGVFEQRRDVAELNARLRKIGDGADQDFRELMWFRGSSGGVMRGRSGVFGGRLPGFSATNRELRDRGRPSNVRPREALASGRPR